MSITLSSFFWKNSCVRYHWTSILLVCVQQAWLHYSTLVHCTWVSKVFWMMVLREMLIIGTFKDCFVEPYNEECKKIFPSSTGRAWRSVEQCLFQIITLQEDFSKSKLELELKSAKYWNTFPCKWSFEKRRFSLLFMKSLYLVLSQMGLAVSLVDRGKVCGHWWPNMNHFYASVTEEGSLQEHANFWGLGSSPS